ncbi:hypothetical protein Taro_026875 [Colocasia esculenta]|uniref:Nucleosome assembly protein 1 n=1 Tax=Colocasia esculenta TaxID=4460 RepID=A0A843VKV1_COLES|nr:hypothetical protein [Colocasia esculenta]
MSNEKQQDVLNLADLCAALIPKCGIVLLCRFARLNAEEREGLVTAMKSKLQSLVGQHTDVLETLSPKVLKRVEVLRKGRFSAFPKHGQSIVGKYMHLFHAFSLFHTYSQKQHDDLEAKFFEERAALEAKYQKLYEPLYTKRYEIVNGVVEVDGISNDGADETPAGDKEPEEKGVPGFWLTAMKTNEVLSEKIQLRDEWVLKYLKNIKWCRIHNPKGFKLEFFFDSNPYFKNTVLTKTYHMIDEDEPILEKAIGTEIEWYPGKCLTQKILKKKPKKGSKNAKPVTKTGSRESFFNFFSPPEVPEDDEDMDEDMAEKLQNQMEQDYDVGSTIRDKIVPHAVSWFTGDAVQDDDFEEIGEDGDEDEEDEDEDDDDEESYDKKARKPKVRAADLRGKASKEIVQPSASRICALVVQSCPDVSPHAVVVLLASASPAPSTGYTSAAVRSSPSTFVDSALRSTNIDLLLDFPGPLRDLAQSPAAASDWVRDKVLTYWPDVRFRYVAVGNEIIFDKGGPVWPVMGPIVEFLRSPGVPLLVNAYPYFSNIGDPQNVDLDYAQFTMSDIVVVDGYKGFEY